MKPIAIPFDQRMNEGCASTLGGQRLQILGVDYTHIHLTNRDDLYLTRFGEVFWPQLLPENWHEREWFEKSREKLLGTSTVYRVRTKAVNGISKDIVVKWCRVGETVPVDTFTLNEFVQADFNSPYEEFALLMEMRAKRYPHPILTHKPLAIYVPAQTLQLWQTGRSESTIARKKARYRDVELDICRQYILIYEWIKGESITEVFQRAGPDLADRETIERRLVLRATQDLKRKGYKVLDMKPQHVIVRTRSDGRLVRHANGNVPYALVDFELLTRTPEHNEEVLSARRAEYLRRQRDRFARAVPHQFTPGLHPVRIFGVDYVYGHTESTNGSLWVAGHDPSLFDFFQPERWRRTKRTNLSRNDKVYHTLTKDKINLVWKISRVGAEPAAVAHEAADSTPVSYNSPFEEFALALELGRRGLPTVYPRAIYMTGRESSTAVDFSRYESHQSILTPEGYSILCADHGYITIWGYWNGTDESLARKDVEHWRGLDCQRALEQGVIDATRFDRILASVRQKLKDLGMISVHLKGGHILLTFDAHGGLLMNTDGLPATRLCNFETIRRL